MTTTISRVQDPARTFVSRRLGPFIDGDFVDASTEKTFATIDPSTGQPICEVGEAGPEDVARAVASARAAFDDGRWRRLKPAKKARVLLRVAELIQANAAELAQLEVLDTGKPLAQATGEVIGTAEVFRYFAGWTTKIAGDTLPTGDDLLTYTLREPVGVCAGITPWNFPINMAGSKLAPALACSNTVVLKPAEETPLTALRLATLLAEAGVPEGVVNVLPGYGETAGAALVDDPRVEMIAFTGSTAVGQHIMGRAAATLKRVTLELGGKSPNIVFADADMRRAAQAAMLGIYTNTGQVCTAGSRLLLDASVADEFVDTLVAESQKLRVGSGFDPESEMGPLISEEQLARVVGYIDSGRSEGARVALGGDRLTGDRFGGGYFVEPTVFVNVRNDMRIAQEEIFGPVVAVIPFHDIEEALAIANDTTYGLAAAVWTADVKVAHRAAKALRAGTVWVNTYGNWDVAVPFGGYKASGIGRENGPAAIDEYTQTKSVWVDLS